MGRVACYSAAYGSDQEGEFLMLPGKGDEALDGLFCAIQAFHCGNGVGLALQALAHSPLCSEVIQSVASGSAGVHSSSVATKDEYLTGI